MFARTSWQVPSGTCIICQGNADKSSNTYGILGHLQISSVVKAWPTETGEYSFRDAVLDTAKRDPYLRGEEHHIPEHGYSKLPSDTLPEDASFFLPVSNLKSPGCMVSTCGHLMHMDCFDEFFRNPRNRYTSQHNNFFSEYMTRNEFICPLCKGIS
jgi:E3 ubiquitin-protein ligase UBR1